MKRFHVLNRCLYGEGVKRDLCLLPYHTLAADNTVHRIGDVIYVPKADGLTLPDGTIHKGFFIVRDTGGAFLGIGGQRVDMFVGTELDTNNIFSRAGLDRRNPMKAYKVTGDSAAYVRQQLKDQFGDLY